MRAAIDYLTFFLRFSISILFLFICFVEELMIELLMVCLGLESPERFAIAHKCPAPCGAFDPFLKCGFMDRLCRTEFFQRSSLLL